MAERRQRAGSEAARHLRVAVHRGQVGEHAAEGQLHVGVADDRVRRRTGQVGRYQDGLDAAHQLQLDRDAGRGREQVVDDLPEDLALIAARAHPDGDRGHAGSRRGLAALKRECLVVVRGERRHERLQLPEPSHEQADARRRELPVRRCHRQIIDLQRLLPVASRPHTERRDGVLQLVQDVRNDRRALRHPVDQHHQLLHAGRHASLAGHPLDPPDHGYQPLAERRELADLPRNALFELVAPERVGIGRGDHDHVPVEGQQIRHDRIHLGHRHGELAQHGLHAERVLAGLQVEQVGLVTAQRRHPIGGGKGKRHGIHFPEGDAPVDPDPPPGPGAAVDVLLGLDRDPVASARGHREGPLDPFPGLRPAVAADRVHPHLVRVVGLDRRVALVVHGEKSRGRARPRVLALDLEQEAGDVSSGGDRVAVLRVGRRLLPLRHGQRRDRHRLDDPGQGDRIVPAAQEERERLGVIAVAEIRRGPARALLDPGPDLVAADVDPHPAAVVPGSGETQVPGLLERHLPVDRDLPHSGDAPAGQRVPGDLDPVEPGPRDGYGPAHRSPLRGQQRHHPVDLPRAWLRVGRREVHAPHDDRPVEPHLRPLPVPAEVVPVRLGDRRQARHQQQDRRNAPRCPADQQPFTRLAGTPTSGA